MSGRLTTHVLDVAAGLPAAAIPLTLYRCDGDARAAIATAETNGDGRTDAPLLQTLVAGVYELVFEVGTYFASQRIGEAFYDRITLRFTIGETERAYHVPLLLSPWSYTTYRGS